MRASDRAGSTWLVLSSLVAWLIVSATMALHLVVAPLLPERIHVRWAPAVAADQRARLEQELALTNGMYREERTWSYVLRDRSPGHIERLVRHPSVEDTHYIDVETFTLIPDDGRPAWIQAIARSRAFQQWQSWLPALAVVFAAVGLPGLWLVVRHPMRSVQRRTTQILSRHRVNLGLAALAVVTLALLTVVSGDIGGNGFDGTDYARVTEAGWRGGNEHSWLRPFIPLVNRALYFVTGDVRQAFVIMNYAYAALLAFALGLLFGRYSDDRWAKVLCVGNVLVCVAALKMTSYYPVMIDLGACAVLTVAVHLIVSNRRSMASAACVAAVLAREFGAAAIVLGIARDVRLRVPFWKTAICYAPAAVVWFALRRFVADSFGAPPNGNLVENLRDWQEPLFAAFFGYFLLTIFGGVSLFVFTQLPTVARHLRREPEWVLFVAVIIGATVVGSWDIWRYMAYLLPAVVVLFAVCARETGVPRPHLAVAAAICAATLLTQRPWQPMDVVAYFRDWFPYYVLQRPGVLHGAAVAMWPLWSWRFVMVGVLFGVLACLPVIGERAESRAGQLRPVDTPPHS